MNVETNGKFNALKINWFISFMLLHLCDDYFDEKNNIYIRNIIIIIESIKNKYKMCK